MSRFYSLGSWFCTSVAIALALLVPLTVPEGAFADSGSSCVSNCDSACVTQCGSDQTCLQMCIAECPVQCCYLACNGDPTCEQNCAQVPAPCVNGQCTPCLFPCEDVCTGPDGCGPDFCNCTSNNNGGCQCVVK